VSSLTAEKWVTREQVIGPSSPVACSPSVRISRPRSRVRESWPSGRLLDPFLTRMSGVPRRGEKGRGASTLQPVLVSMVSLASGVALAAACAIRGGWALILLPPAWVLTLHGLRNLALTVLHQCAHRAFFGGVRRWNDRLGDLLAAVSFVQSYRSFRREHLECHHPVLMSRDDPAVRFPIDVLGLRPGASLAMLERRLLGRLVSPLFHLRLLALRGRWWWDEASAWQRGAGILHVFAVGVIGVFHPLPLLLAWILPLTLLLDLPVALKDCLEHVHPPPGTPEGEARIPLCTHQIRFGESAPTSSRGPRATLCWIRWWLVLLVYHVPARLVFAPGEGVVHDWHHRRPRDPDWPSGILARQVCVEEWHRQGGATFEPPWTHVWGLHAALRENLMSLSRARPEDLQREAGRRP